MKKTLITFVAIMLVTVTIFTSCQSSAQKEKVAEENLQGAQKDLEKAQDNADEDAAKTAKAEDWRIFKLDAEAKIKANEIRIAGIREKMKTSGKAPDAIYQTKIDLLEQQNKNMTARIEAYTKTQSDWEEFKREFNHDMDQLGEALKDITVNNKN